MYGLQCNFNAFSAASKRPSTATAHHTTIHSPCQHQRAAYVTCSAFSCTSSTGHITSHSSRLTAVASAGSCRGQGMQELYRSRSSTFQHLQMHQQYPGHRSATTHVCRVLTESADMALGSKAPDFELLEPLTGKQVSLSSLSSGSKATLVMFICNHCPFVVMLKDAIAKLAKEYQAKGVAVVAISSNSTQTHPQDGPDKMAEDAKKCGYTFPYLFDESQAVAKAYKAACTPEFYVFDAKQQLTYHGQFDDARPNSNKLVTGSDLRTALDAALSGNGLPEGFKAKPSIGCNIKWTPGAEPDYYGAQIVQK